MENGPPKCRESRDILLSTPSNCNEYDDNIKKRGIYMNYSISPNAAYILFW